MRIREATTAATLASSRENDAGEERVEGSFACPSPGLPTRVFTIPSRIVLTAVEVEGVRIVFKWNVMSRPRASHVCDVCLAIESSSISKSARRYL